MAELNPMLVQQQASSLAEQNEGRLRVETAGESLPPEHDLVQRSGYSRLQAERGDNLGRAQQGWP